MSAAAAPLPRPAPRRSTAAGLLGLALALGLLLAGLFAPRVVLHGWLVAFALAAGTALGCVAWLAIHALTGGRWGAAFRPALLAGAGALPLALALALPLVGAARWLYPWAADPAAAGPGVAALYLNPGLFALRSLVLLAGLALAGRAARRRTGLGVLPAALALVLYGGLTNLVGIDWLLSLDPRYTASAFGMQVIVAQLLAALCLAALLSPTPAGDAAWGDLGALMLACLMGEAYLLLMTFVIHWYGDLPDQAAWYLRRGTGGWRWLVALFTLAGAVGPGLALLVGRVRRSRGGVRAAAVAILLGLWAETVWLVVPALDGAAAVAGGLLVAALATAACAAMLLALGSRAGRSSPEVADGR